MDISNYPYFTYRNGAIIFRSRELECTLQLSISTKEDFDKVNGCYKCAKRFFYNKLVKDSLYNISIIYTVHIDDEKKGFYRVSKEPGSKLLLYSSLDKAIDACIRSLKEEL